MTLQEFDDAVRESGELEILGMRDDDVLVKNTTRGYVWAVPLDTIMDTPENQLLGVLLARRPAMCLRHMSRIVGYYSLVQNWNKSKLAELKDRHAGTYALPTEERALKSQEWPTDIVKEQLESNAERAVCKTKADGDVRTERSKERDSGVKN